MTGSTAWVTSGPPLARDGLLRLADLAGLAVTDAVADATISLQCPGSGPSGRPVEVAVEPDTVTVVISATPDDHTWAALRLLVTEVLGAS